MRVLTVCGLAIAQFVPAFLALDLIFRYMDVTPSGLRGRLRRYGLIYAGTGVVFGLAGATVQWRLAGAPGLAAAVLNAVPWWLLWRFGLRKQLTYLFKDDRGRPHGAENPDP